MVKAHAKINLALNVNSKMDNGYHDLDMVVLPLELHDRVEFEFLPQEYDTLITCDDISLPTDETNLTVKAFQAVVEKYNITRKFRIHVHKIIPVSAGLGGGSADAAAVINTVLKMMKIYPSREELISLAKEVGSDVPFCLFNRPSRCKGVGEAIEVLKVKPKYFALIVKPKEGISTKEAYERYDMLKETERGDIDALINALENGDERIIAENMKNGLEKAAIQVVPEIMEIKQRLIDDGFPLTLMSGSGSSVFALSTNPRLLQSEIYRFDPQKYYIRITSLL